MKKPFKNQIAFAYSGQGSSFAGMGLPYQKYPLFTRRVQIADTICKKLGDFPVSEFLYSKHVLSPIEILKRGNLALFVYQVALTETVLGFCSQPDFMIGHSFGEYSTWVLSGCLSFKDGMRLVLKREEVCPPCNEAGYMLVVQTDYKTLESVLPNKINRLSVVNHKLQQVLSLEWQELLEAEEILKREKIVFKRLLSPQPYHSKVLEKSAIRLSEYINSIESFDFPRNNFYSPTLESWVTRENCSRSLLSTFVEKQLSCPYNFAKSMEEIKCDLKEVIVLSPTQGLMQLLKNNLSDVTLSHANEWMDRSNTEPETKIQAHSLSSKSIEKVNKVISRITGYKIEDIKLEQRLSDDLGLDSIKTAEIVFEYMDQMKVSPSAFREARLGQLITVKDLVLLAEKAGEVTLEEKKRPLFENETVFQWGKYDWKISPLEKFSQLKEIPYTLVVLPEQKISDLKSLTEFKDVLRREFTNVLESLKKIESLVLVSAQSFSEVGEIATPFFRSLVKEGALKQFTHLIFDKIPEEKILRATIQEELSVGNAETALYLKGNRYTEKFVVHTQFGSQTPSSYDCIVAIGGSRGITRELLKSFAPKSIKKLYLIGRTPEGELSSESVHTFKQRAENFTYLQADATQSNDLMEALKAIAAKDKINLLIHSSGMELSQELSKKSFDEIWKEFESKVAPVLAVTDSKVPIDQVWYHSSIIGRYGNAGQSIYALANKTAEVLLKDKITFAWPPWQDTGMTEKNAIAVFLRSTGVGLLGRKQAGHIFQETLHSGMKGNLAAITQDLPLYTVPLINKQSRANCEIEWQKGMPGFIFSYEKENTFLKDHNYRGTILFPMAAAVSLSLSAAKAVYNAPIRLRNFKILKPLPVTGSGQMRITLKGKAEMLAVDLLAQGPFVECVADAFTQDIEKIETENLGDHKYLSSQLYKPELLFHGPYFQTIQEITVEKSTLLATINPSNWIQSAELGAFGNFAQLVDTSLQLGGIGAWALFDKKCLPVGFESLSYTETFRLDKLRTILLRNAKLNGEHFHCDLLACEEDGNASLSIQNATFSSIPSAQS